MISRILFAVLVTIFSSTLCWAEQPTAEQKFVQHATRYITTHSPQLDKDRGYWLAEQIYASAKLFSIDPHMLLALIKVESRFDSAAESPHGAKGLMQIVPRYHRQRIAEAGSIFQAGILDTRVNLYVGASFLSDLLDENTIAEALQRYNGSAQKRKYARTVIAEYREIQRTIL